MSDISKPITQTDPRKVCSEAFFECIAARLVKEHPTFDVELAERITEQGFAYLYTAARTEVLLSPSPLVDLAWHAMILHTREYADWCDTYAGHFVHHVPEDRAVDRAEAAKVRNRTVQAIIGQGFALDDALWPALSAECNQCHAGCHDSPK
ncbi:glycine-rich domain-containing protein [Streptomyces sp. NPDC056910]|uniref:glycine-rich domain-containing protein n=1 Tax=Streptomyces sp. NPDC056910 TaxID=3345964 RepID=UPI00367FCE64